MLWRYTNWGIVPGLLQKYYQFPQSIINLFLNFQLFEQNFTFVF